MVFNTLKRIGSHHEWPPFRRRRGGPDLRPDRRRLLLLSPSWLPPAPRRPRVRDLRCGRRRPPRIRPRRRPRGADDEGPLHAPRPPRPPRPRRRRRHHAARRRRRPPPRLRRPRQLLHRRRHLRRREGLRGAGGADHRAAGGRGRREAERRRRGLRPRTDHGGRRGGGRWESAGGEVTDGEPVRGGAVRAVRDGGDASGGGA